MQSNNLTPYFPPITLIQHMRFETVKDTFLLFFLFPFFCLLIGYVLGERPGLIAGSLFAMLVMGCIYFFPELYITKLFPSTPLEGIDPWGLNNKIKKLSSKANIQKPSLYILEVETPTSFSISRNSKKIYISRGVLDSFSQREIFAILSHEFARISLQKTLSLNIAGFGLFMLYSLSSGLDTLLNHIFFFYRVFQKGHKISIIRKLITPLSRTLLKSFVNPSTFYKSDLLASRLTNEPEVLAHVLWKLKSYSFKKQLPILPQAAHYFIIHPNMQSTWSFHQPTVESRIQNLVGEFPI